MAKTSSNPRGAGMTPPATRMTSPHFTGGGSASVEEARRSILPPPGDHCVSLPAPVMLWDGSLRSQRESEHSNVGLTNHKTQRNHRRPKDTVTTLRTGPCTPHHRKPSCPRHHMEEPALPQGLRAGPRYPGKKSRRWIGAHGPGRLHSTE